MSCIVIAGAPRTGKTTLGKDLASKSGAPLYHTDDLIELGWSEASEKVARHWLNLPGPWIIEGVAAVRGLRKFLRWYPGEQPCDRVIWKMHAWVPLTVGQARMARGCAKVFREIREDLGRVGVEIVQW